MKRIYLIPVRAFQPLTIITGSPLPSGQQGVAYSTTMVAVGGSPPYTWTLTGGSLDSGVTLSSGGVISGTPANAETDTVQITVTDSLGGTTSGTFSVTFASTSGQWPNGQVNAASLNWADVSAAV